MRFQRTIDGAYCSSKTGINVVWDSNAPVICIGHYGTILIIFVLCDYCRCE